MKKLNYIFLTITFLLFATNVFTQTDIVPDLKIECPQTPIRAGETVALSAKINPVPSNATYNWSVSVGQIIKGQGTSQIEIETFREMDGGISVSLEVQTNEFLERPTAYCQILIYPEPQARLLDEFNFSTQGEIKMRLHNEFFIELQNDPSAQGYIFIFPKTVREQVQIEKIIRDYAATVRVDTSRFTTVIGDKSNRSYLQFWIAPAGAETPKPEIKDEYRIPQPQTTVGANASACELNALYLDTLRNELAQNPNLSLQIVFSPGKDETAAVNLKRQKIFMNKIKFYRFSNVETQIGEKTEGNGEVAIFLKNPDGTEQFYLLIYAIKNKSVCLNCCEPTDMPKSLVTTKKTTKKKQK